MNTIDPAWFYSSIAQVSAAIVGIIGAVLGSRIINHIDLMRVARRELEQEIKGTYRQIQDRIEFLLGFRQYIEREIPQDREVIRVGGSHRQVTSQISWGSSLSGSPWSIDANEHLATLQTDLVDLEKVTPVYVPLSGVIDDTFMSTYAAKLRVTADTLHERAKGIITADADAIERLRNHIAEFRQKLLPQSFIIVFLVLIWLAVTGILWPLSALPGFPNDYSKPIMLFSLGIGLLGLVGFFIYQMSEIVRLGGILKWPVK